MTLEVWRQRARRLKRDTYALYLAARDPRVPWYTKALALGVVGYALSPLDLIPDFVPIIGYLDGDWSGRTIVEGTGSTWA
jgi:uncharacterized membrane protein YkvA (DUF1232 family)